MRRAPTAIAVAAMIAGTPPIDQMRREIRREKVVPSGKDRTKIKAARKQRRKQKR